MIMEEEPPSEQADAEEADTDETVTESESAAGIRFRPSSFVPDGEAVPDLADGAADAFGFDRNVVAEPRSAARGDRFICRAVGILFPACAERRADQPDGA